MQKFEIEISPSAREELRTIVEFIALDNLQASLKWYDNLLLRIISLEKNPERCPHAIENAFHDFEIRHLIFGNYRIVFRIIAETVQILHIRHSKMNPKEI